MSQENTPQRAQAPEQKLSRAERRRILRNKHKEMRRQASPHLQDRQGLTVGTQQKLDPRPPLPQISSKQRSVLLYLASLFDVHGAPGDQRITEGQLRIFGALVYRTHNRVQILCSTQYGKSLWVALACLIIACIQGRRVAIVAPSDSKAKIIMRYFINHLGDNALFYGKLEKNTKLERLRQEESKNSIMLNNGGGIFVVSAQQHSAGKSLEAAMGEGAEIVIEDESGLLKDDTEATIFRMIAGKGKEGFYCKIGNPFYSMPPYSHFYTTWHSLRYLRIFIDYEQALAEGRYQPDFIEEARSKPLFDILYGCEFPSQDVMDKEGYRPVIMTEWLNFGMTPERLLEIIEKDRAKYTQPDGRVRLPYPVKAGGDIAGGGDRNVYTVRYGMFGCSVSANTSADTMQQVVEVERIAEQFNVRAEDFNIDDVGIGHGVSDRLWERGFHCNRVNVGEAARDSETFANLKAELIWACRLWVQNPEHRLDARDEWVELAQLRYKTQSDRRVIMESKEKLRARIGASPDYAESLYLTFAEQPFVGFA